MPLHDDKTTPRPDPRRQNDQTRRIDRQDSVDYSEPPGKRIFDVTDTHPAPPNPHRDDAETKK
jgi:hypothetical protein